MERKYFWFKNNPIALNQCQGQGEKTVEKKERTQGLEE
jgi:hypothetical protein